MLKKWQIVTSNQIMEYKKYKTLKKLHMMKREKYERKATILGSLGTLNLRQLFLVHLTLDSYFNEAEELPSQPVQLKGSNLVPSKRMMSFFYTNSQTEISTEKKELKSGIDYRNLVINTLKASL